MKTFEVLLHFDDLEFTSELYIKKLKFKESRWPLYTICVRAPNNKKTPISNYRRYGIRRFRNYSSARDHFRNLVESQDKLMFYGPYIAFKRKWYVLDEMT